MLNSCMTTTNCCCNGCRCSCDAPRVTRFTTEMKKINWSLLRAVEEYDVENFAAQVTQLVHFAAHFLRLWLPGLSCGTVMLSSP